MVLDMYFPQNTLFLQLFYIASCLKWCKLIPFSMLFILLVEDMHVVLFSKRYLSELICVNCFRADIQPISSSVNIHVSIM